MDPFNHGPLFSKCVSPFIKITVSWGRMQPYKLQRTNTTEAHAYMFCLPVSLCLSHTHRSDVSHAGQEVLVQLFKTCFGALTIWRTLSVHITNRASVGSKYDK